MDVQQLVGRHVRVRSWDLFGAPVDAVVQAIEVDSKSLLLEFVVAAQIGAHTYPLAVAHPRLLRDDLGILVREGVLGCALTCVPREHYDATRPFDLSWWRGGAAAIADILLNADPPQ